MIRLGSSPPETREMDLDDIFFSRLKLMIIMAKAFLEDYPLGKHRSRAMLENAKHIEMDATQIGAPTATNSFFYSEPSENVLHNHIFLQRVKLLAAMLKAVAKGYSMGKDRKTAMKKNLDAICQTLIHSGLAEDMSSFKVA